MTFTKSEMKALRRLVDCCAAHCGGGEDTIGAILYTGAFHFLDNNDSAVVDLAHKIDSFTATEEESSAIVRSRLHAS